MEEINVTMEELNAFLTRQVERVRREHKESLDLLAMWSDFYALDQRVQIDLLNETKTHIIKHGWVE